MDNNNKLIPTEDGLVKLVTSILDENKAQDIALIDLKGKADFARYMVLASGRSIKHVTSLGERLMEELKHKTGCGISAEGIGHSPWVLVDAADVIVHIFTPEMRTHYSLEEIWGFGKKLPHSENATAL